MKAKLILETETKSLQGNIQRDTIIETEFYEDNLENTGKRVSFLLKKFNKVIRKNHMVTPEYEQHQNFPEYYEEFLKFAESMKVSLFIADILVYENCNLISTCIDWKEIENLLNNESYENGYLIEYQDIYKMIKNEKQLSF